jgi:magnesium chelatase family protein
MAIATVNCRAQLGLYAPLVQVEVSLGAGLPVFSIVGLPATVVKESKDRVRAALVNAGFEFPSGRITVNLSPADIPKRGGRFDLPIALGILLASEQLKAHPAQVSDLSALEFYGELGLNGELRSVHGILLAAAHAARDGREILVPQANSEEVRVLLGRLRHTIEVARDSQRDSERACSGTGSGRPPQSAASDQIHHGPIIRAANHLLAVCAHLDGSTPLPILRPPQQPAAGWISESPLDLSDVRGQLQAKRALTIAAAGGHSLLMIGPPGAGKSMLAMRLPGLLPPMTEREALEVATIASVSGVFNARHFGRRPMRTPHHTTSAVALIGGGSRAQPGEISLAHHGVLFLDELLEYERRALEALREPLESGVVSIARATHHTQYPAEFQLIAAMNPCPCGRYGDPRGDCRCTPQQIVQYRSRLSAPLLERLDIHLEVPCVEFSDFEERSLPVETSASVVTRVTRAREMQLERQGKSNARLADAQIERICSPDRAGRSLLDRAMKKLGFSARARQRILKVARTIADLNGAAIVGSSHVAEAVTYRTLDRRPPPEESPATPSGDLATRG